VKWLKKTSFLSFRKIIISPCTYGNEFVEIIYYEFDRPLIAHFLSLQRPSNSSESKAKSVIVRIFISVSIKSKIT
jgi:hypothetical protein